MYRPSAADAQVYTNWLLRHRDRPSDPAAFGGWLLATFFEDTQATLQAHARVQALCAVTTEADLRHQLFWAVFEGAFDLAVLSWAQAYGYAGSPVDAVRTFRRAKALVAMHKAEAPGQPFGSWLEQRVCPTARNAHGELVLPTAVREARTSTERLVALMRSVLERQLAPAVLFDASC